MELAASFVFENCSYYMPFAQRSVYRVGAGKKDDIAVKSLPAAALTFRRRGEVLSVLAKMTARRGWARRSRPAWRSRPFRCPITGW